MVLAVRAVSVCRVASVAQGGLSDLHQKAVVVLAFPGVLVFRAVCVPQEAVTPQELVW